MLETYEIRWFFYSPLEAFQHWKGNFERRTDWYAPIWNETSSVKIREAHLETKFLLGERPTPIGTTEFDLQHWTKSSQPLPSEEEKQVVASATAHWLGIEKTRSVQHFSLVGNDIRRQPLPNRDTVQVEWTQLSLDGRTDAWTLCLESSAASGAESLLRVLLDLLNRMNLNAAKFPPAQSYPRWIRNQTENGDLRRRIDGDPSIEG